MSISLSGALPISISYFISHQNDHIWKMGFYDNTAECSGTKTSPNHNHVIREKFGMISESDGDPMPVAADFV